LLPADRIQVRFVGNEAIPVWLAAEDHPWIRALIDDFARLDGRPYREAVAFLQEPPRTTSHPGKRRMAIWRLLDLSTRERPPVDAGELRGAIAITAQEARNKDQFDRSEVLASCAGRLGLSADEVDGQLFADLPGERRLDRKSVV
jgi:predicted nuclease of restriction endonuclease-like RecB superfamily